MAVMKYDSMHTYLQIMRQDLRLHSCYRQKHTWVSCRY